MVDAIHVAIARYHSIESRGQLPVATAGTVVRSEVVDRRLPD